MKNSIIKSSHFSLDMVNIVENIQAKEHTEHLSSRSVGSYILWELKTLYGKVFVVFSHVFESVLILHSSTRGAIMCQKIALFELSMLCLEQGSVYSIYSAHGLFLINSLFPGSVDWIQHKTLLWGNSVSGYVIYFGGLLLLISHSRAHVNYISIYKVRWKFLSWAGESIFDIFLTLSLYVLGTTVKFSDVAEEMIVTPLCP